MIQPPEMKVDRPMEIANGTISSTTKVWRILRASYEGNLSEVQKLVSECNDLAYAQYNYAPPIHLAVREGHKSLVEFLLAKNAFTRDYLSYPFLDNLVTLAKDRKDVEIATMLDAYLKEETPFPFQGDNGKIDYGKTAKEQEFENAIDQGNIAQTRSMLNEDPSLVANQDYFWGEGILMMPAKDRNFELVELLLERGASIPSILKWTQKYYFKHIDMATFLLQHGMDPNTISCHRVSILHDIAQNGNIPKADLLLRHGADVNLIDDEYRSTPLGLAVRWGHLEMAKFLVEAGADIHRAGSTWSTPLVWANTKGYNEIEEYLKHRTAR